MKWSFFCSGIAVGLDWLVDEDEDEDWGNGDDH
jgi:hypothetical protein